MSEHTALYYSRIDLLIMYLLWCNTDLNTGIMDNYIWSIRGLYIRTHRSPHFIKKVIQFLEYGPLMFTG